MGTVNVQITIKANNEIHKSIVTTFPLDDSESEEKRYKLLYILAEDLNKKITEKRVVLDQGDKLVVFSNYENMIGWIEFV